MKNFLVTQIIGPDRIGSVFVVVIVFQVWFKKFLGLDFFNNTNLVTNEANYLVHDKSILPLLKSNSNTVFRLIIDWLFLFYLLQYGIGKKQPKALYCECVIEV